MEVGGNDRRLQFKCCFLPYSFSLKTDFGWPKRQDSRAKLQIRLDLTQIRKKSVLLGLVTVKTKENCEPAIQVKITAVTLRKIHSARHQPRPPVGVCHAWGGAAVGRQHTVMYVLVR